MKTQPLPVCPSRVSIDDHSGFVILKIRVPSRVAAMLQENAAGFTLIPSADIGLPDYMRHRIRNWRPGKTYGKQAARPEPLTGRQRLENIVSEGCDTVIRVAISPQEWELVGTLCSTLGITPGQWFSSCAHYNAAVAERDVENALAKLETTGDQV
jgi:hypothetical protein